ncbi:hypothetical protein QR66_09865 [Chromobacterium piscinae]|nr:hypothetical protein QR66_09865 [Chromobacterium piscinae]
MQRFNFFSSSQASDFSMIIIQHNQGAFDWRCRYAANLRNQLIPFPQFHDEIAYERSQVIFDFFHLFWIGTP